MWQEEQDRLYIHIHVDRYIILYRKRERKLLTFWGRPSCTYVVDDSLQEKNRRNTKERQELFVYITL
jgi:hypothetical protein